MRPRVSESLIALQYSFCCSCGDAFSIGCAGAYLRSPSGRITNSYHVGDGYSNSEFDIKYCAYSTKDRLRITGDAAMFADNKAISLEEMKDLNNSVYK